MSDMSSVNAVVLAAGAGTGLRPLTSSVPKPLVPVGNRPVMEHIVRRLASAGVRTVGVNVHTHADLVRAYFGDGSAFGVDITWSVESTLRGTAGGARPLALAAAGDTVIVTCSDLVQEVDYAALVEFHRASGAVATVGLLTLSDEVLAEFECGYVVAEDDGRVREFQPRPVKNPPVNTVAGGVYVFDAAIHERVPTDTPYDYAWDLFPALVEEGAAVYGYRLSGYFNAVDEWPEFLESNLDFVAGKTHLQRPGTETAPEVWVEEGATIAATASIVGPVLVGAGATIGADAVIIGPAIIGTAATVGAGASLMAGLLLPGGELAPGAALVGGIGGDLRRWADVVRSAGAVVEHV